MGGQKKSKENLNLHDSSDNEDDGSSDEGYVVERIVDKRTNNEVVIIE